MSILSQELVDYLNQANAGLGEWLEQNPVVRNFVTCPYISIRPTAMPHAQRITAFDGERGRFIDIFYRDGSHRYIINVANWKLTIAGMEDLTIALARVAGSCHVERAYLIVFVPAGYSLEVSQAEIGPRLELRPVEVAETV